LRTLHDGAHTQKPEYRFIDRRQVMQRFAIRSQPAALEPLQFYRATELGRSPGAGVAALARSSYLHDVLQMCERGIRERDLRQFMPPASLREAVQSLLELGLIERLQDPPDEPLH
jgi:hypothetical protein